jgi:hypothetical protein
MTYKEIQAFRKGEKCYNVGYVDRQVSTSNDVCCCVSDFSIV